MVSHATDTTPAEPGLERILTTAIDLFGRHGVKATSVRAIAEQAGVSPPLVIHHYGSKEKLREACDDRVLAFIRESKAETMRAGLGGPPIQVDTRVAQARPALRYLARTLSEGSPRLDEFVDDLVEDAVGYTAQGVETGLVLPSANPRARVIILTLGSLGALVLLEHMQRLLGEDLEIRADRCEGIGLCAEALELGMGSVPSRAPGQHRLGQQRLAPAAREALAVEVAGMQ